MSLSQIHRFQRIGAFNRPLKTHRRSFCVGLGSLLAAVATAASPLQNGDFEVGTLSNWSTSGNVFVFSDLQFNAVGFPGTYPSGRFAAVFSGGDRPNDGVISQSFATVATQAYEVSFDFGKLSIGSAAQSVEVTLRDTLSNLSLATFSASDSSGASNIGQVMSPFTFSFVATGITSTISFRDSSLGTISADGVLDNILVSSIPEPSSIGLFAIGLIGVCLARRKRAAA